MRRLFLTLALLTFSTTAFAQTAETPGALTVLDAQGKSKANCPLKHTDVKAEISGFISRVVVTQQFENPFKEKIEAVYTFPLPQNAAVDDMTMNVGERTIRGKILPREEARVVYETAKASGQVASLLDQERPNIFTQAVANILPGEQVKITISYVETLSYVNGAYEFVFPMVVGPRYIPATVPDASRITPKVLPSTTRSGHDISLDVALDAGLIIDNLSSTTHPVDIQRPDSRSARLRLKENSTIPNKDFVLRYDIATQAIQDAVLTHRSEKGGFFTMILQPPDRITVADVMPKELVFVLDTSGSMQGFPIEKAKETMKLALDNLNPSDTFNLITFSGDTHILFPEPVPATSENLQKAQAFLSSRSGAGGTEMMKAIEAALKPSDDQSHVRIVCFMTDGYVGNDMEIIAEVQKHPNARVFAFGIGNAVNRFLLDKMADAGRGEVEYVGLNDDGSAAARRFHERVRNPLLTDISIEWNGLPVADVYPQRIPDLFSVGLLTFGKKAIRKTSKASLGGPGLGIAGSTSDRQRVADTRVSPFRKICDLEITAADGTLASGTAWFITPRTLVTCGHCVFVFSPGTSVHGMVNKVLVMPARNGETDESQSLIGWVEVQQENLRVHDRWRFEGNLDFDYGVIILPDNQALGDQVGFFNFDSFSDQELNGALPTLSGYPDNVPEGTQWFETNPIRQVAPAHIFYDIFTFGGQSGSPVFFADNEEQTACAIHNFGNIPFNRGVRITSDVKAQLNTWKV